MRISYRIGFVGGIPIAIAAAIALFALFLLREAEQARKGALLAGAVYRNMLSVAATRNSYVNPLSLDRDRDAARFYGFAAQARRQLAALAELPRSPAQAAATAAASGALTRYWDRMGELVKVTKANDRLISEIGSRAISLIALTDQARERQHVSNADIAESLRDEDRKLSAARDIVEGVVELRIALASLDTETNALSRSDPGSDGSPQARRQFDFGLVRLHNAGASLAGLLRVAGRADEAKTLNEVMLAYQSALAASQPGQATSPTPSGTPSLGEAEHRFVDWCDRLLKVASTEQRALHEEVAQLLVYSVSAGETEQATQNIAIDTLKLGQRTDDALARRNVVAARTILAESQDLATTVASLPISPLIQSEMLDAMAQWREGLATTTAGLEKQNAMIADMDAIADAMIDEARRLNDLFSAHAEHIGTFIRNLLVFGAAVGLLLGAVTAYVVARSLTKPLRRLQQRMVDLAARPGSGTVEGLGRRDELGDMARAVNFFVTEIGSREQALRRAKERADTALTELQQTQTELIRAEKLASLGALVAGIAHEINTPLGIALTTATVIEDEARRFGLLAGEGTLRRSDLQRFVDRMAEGSRLLFTNLTRAADLVQSFKQVSADQASGERRRFGIKAWLHDLLTSIGPVLRKSGHHVAIEAPKDFVVDSFPGALAQVLTNLIMNSVVHAYAPGEAGHMTLTLSEARPEHVRLVFADDGKGIPPELHGKIFDPFFTTRRSKGSTGLGLHIVYNLVTAKLQGKLSLESEVGKGTRFVIDLPESVNDGASERVLAPT
jgi:signal transduction histidine kinase